MRARELACPKRGGDEEEELERTNGWKKGKASFLSHFPHAHSAAATITTTNLSSFRWRRRRRRKRPHQHAHMLCTIVQYMSARRKRRTEEDVICQEK